MSFVLLIAVTAITVAVFFGLFWSTGTEMDVPLSQVVSLAVEGRVQEIRVDEVGELGASKFIVLLDDGSELVGRAESLAELRRAFEQARVANLDNLIKLR